MISEIKGNSLISKQDYTIIEKCKYINVLA